MIVTSIKSDPVKTSKVSVWIYENYSRQTTQIKLQGHRKSSGYKYLNFIKGYFVCMFSCQEKKLQNTDRYSCFLLNRISN